MKGITVDKDMTPRVGQFVLSDNHSSVRIAEQDLPPDIGVDAS